MEFAKMQQKWQQRWLSQKAFEARPDGRAKFFLTFPYPYVNGYSHIGHLYTSMRVDAFARYKRLRGYNVLFPQGWHATGSPIVNAAKRVKEREPKQIAILKEMGIKEEDFYLFEDAAYWVDFFAPKFKQDFISLGFSIDWTREFVTTSLNPHYDTFIEWQFRKLKEKGYVIQGKFPVVWDPKNNCAVGDHDRVEGEGETPQEFTLIKFKLSDSNEYIVVATLRPETVYGQTNIWVHPDIVYKRVKVNNESWIISSDCVQKLKEQGYAVQILGDVAGKTLIGKKTVAPALEQEIPVLPSFFPKADKGTGLVTSVPSDAPDDYMGLIDLQHDAKLCIQYGLNVDEIKKIEIIPIITTDVGDLAAVTICKQMGIKNQKERAKLEEAKKIVYKKGFYEGKMNSRCGKYSGMSVQKAKELVKKELLDSGKAHLMYELTGPVVSRALVPCVVKIVDDQWFIDYYNPSWKKLAHDCMKQMRFYPEKVRQQFDFVIDWLHEWACTREEGLGTRLPWDKKWLIEALSDSTIYTAYYTIVPHLMQMKPSELTDDVYDFIFYGKGNSSDPRVLDARKEFLYWYPVDFRNSGKDLVQNHLSFFIFNHAALFDKKQWPRAIGVNGHILVDAQKMSKSKGNFLMTKDMVAKYGADASRATVLNGGEGLDDANWETSFAENFNKKLSSVLDTVEKYYGKGRNEVNDSDTWLESKTNTIIRDVTALMEETLFRSAIQKIYFEYQNVLSKYVSKVDEVHKEIFSKALESQIVMMSAFTPHASEEAWEKMKKRGFVSLFNWPSADERKIDPTAEAIQDFTDLTLGNVEALRTRLGKKAERIELGIAPEWKYRFAREMTTQLKKTYNVKELIDYFKTKKEFDKFMPFLMEEIPKIVKKPARLPAHFLERTEEFKALEKIAIKLEEKYDCEVVIVDVGELAEKAFPGSVGVRV